MNKREVMKKKKLIFIEKIIQPRKFILPFKIFFIFFCIFLSGFLFLVSYSTHSVKNTRIRTYDNRLEIDSILYKEKIPIEDILINEIRIINLKENNEYNISFKENIFGLPGYGWKQLKNGKKALVFLTNKENVLLLPTRDYIILFSMEKEEKFIKKMINENKIEIWEYITPPKYIIIINIIYFLSLILLVMSLRYLDIKNVKIYVYDILYGNKEMVIKSFLNKKEKILINNIYINEIQTINMKQNTEYDLSLKSKLLHLGFLNFGWIKLNNGKKALVYLTDKEKVLLMPTRDFVVLFSMENVEDFKNNLSNL